MRRNKRSFFIMRMIILTPVTIRLSLQLQLYSLVIFSYIGHAFIDNTSKPNLSSTSGKRTIESDTVRTELTIYKETLKHLCWESWAVATLRRSEES